MNDQDEFQFRPLTEGLGFHKKSSETSSEAPFGGSNKFSHLPEMNSPLPRKKMETKTTPSRALPQAKIQTNNTVDEILKTLNQKRNLDFLDEKKLLNEVPEMQYSPSSFDLPAGLLDGMLITATTLLCLIILLMITKVDLFNNLTHPDSQGLIYISMVALVLGITWIYLVGNRIALGFTPGEWVFDQRLGTPEQMDTAEYSLKIVARSTAIIATGLFLFPLFSFQRFGGLIRAVQAVAMPARA